MNTQSEIVEEGAHLEQVRSLCASIGLTIFLVAPEVAVHCDEEQATALLDFARTVLKPVVENLDGQLDTLKAQWDTAKPEVDALEQLLKLPEAVRTGEQEQPGPGLYL